MAAGDLTGAEAAFRSCLDAAGRLPIFTSWAAAQLAQVLIRRGDPAGAAPYVDLAFRGGTPAVLYEARLAGVELAFARGEPAAPSLAAEAVGLAEEEGFLDCAERLRMIMTRSGSSDA